MRKNRPLRALFLSFGLLTAGFVLTSPLHAGEVTHSGAARPLESPGGTCYKWKYPDKSECGKLKGTEECKGEASIDEKKKEACPPVKGDECACGDDDF